MFFFYSLKIFRLYIKTYIKNYANHLMLKHLRSRLLKPHNSRQQVGGLDTGSIGDKATVVTAFISPAAEHLAEKLEPRSEEHTSELQSPIDISYAVFCLKKKKKK